MAEESGSEAPAEAQAEAEPEDAVPAEIAALSESGRELLAISQDVLKDFRLEPGALDDIPQLRVDPEDTAKICSLAKDDPRLAMRQLLCLACVDYQETLELVYFLRSYEPDRTLVIKTSVPIDNPRLPSVTPVWRAGEWYEREAHDLFGVIFDGHPSLSPLLLYDGFEGYPGRRDFPFNDYQEF